MIGTSVLDYIHIQFWIIILSSVVPLSITYYLYSLFRLLPLPPSISTYLPAIPLPLPVQIYALAEILFHFFVYYPLRRHLQRAAIYPPAHSREEREALFTLCNDSVTDPGDYVSKWFMGAPLEDIKRDDVKGFFRWAFLNADDDKDEEDDEEEVESYCRRLEAKLGQEIPPGKTGVKCLRLTLDEVPMTHRSLLWCGAVFFVDNMTYFLLTFPPHKYHHHRTPLSKSMVFPPRPQTFLFSHAISSTPNLSYFHRPHTSQTRLPVLFLHGIGIGLYPYVPFLTALAKSHPDEEGEPGIIAIEILPVSFRITSPVLEREEMCRSIQQILTHHGYDRVVLVTHSYGSILATHALLSPLLSPRIANLVLVDPVSILLHLPDVAYNFTRRRPRTANHHQLSYFASLDPSVAHTLARRFFWADNILWLHHLSRPGLHLLRGTSIWLAGRDLIVSTPKVREYLESEDGRKKGVEVHWCPELDHGQIFDSKRWLKELVEDVRDATVLRRVEATKE